MSVLEAILDDPATKEAYAKKTPVEQAVINWRLNWTAIQAHKHQLEPAGDWWNIWLMLAGRGGRQDPSRIRDFGRMGVGATRHTMACLRTHQR